MTESPKEDTPETAPPTSEERTLAHKRVESWVKGCSMGTRNTLSGHEITALKESIAWALARHAYAGD